MNAEIIDFIDIWRAKRGLSRDQALELMKIRPSGVGPLDASNVLYVDDVMPRLLDVKAVRPHN